MALLTPHPTAYTPPALTLVARASPALCGWCQRKPVRPEHGQVFCGASCRQQNNAAKWGGAPGAVAGLLTPLTGIDGCDEFRHKLTAGVKRLFAEKGRTPEGQVWRAGIVERLGMKWVPEVKQWQSQKV